ncbi:CHASE2 domain-containing protein [Scytonema sp. UIC 10036]|uniref:CHASE2 domain-containing protein n=1 Tax=Scytonema sp. UIC 10036 TaxID=2304196 RepID=UPI001384A536|nr:CHASE2 domain-containing protein [Scytonema sp. UIC 10036]
MRKLVVFELGEGDFESGFPIRLQIGEEGKNPSVEIRGKLPPNPDIIKHYEIWNSAYCNLEMLYRLSSKNKGKATRGSFLKDCNHAANILRNSLNIWLNSDALRLIREKFIQKVSSEDEMRVLIQTMDVRLQRFPWHLWNLFESYPKAEVAVISPFYECVGKRPTKSRVRILAILGNSTGINTQADAALLKQQLPDAEILFLSEPQRQELTEKLWDDKGWDILFFAGHSSSQLDGESGWIHINQTDTLTIAELKQSLKKAVENGLKLAIFNSCDGLGLARSLVDLCIPQMIVMRQPVPDKVAQTFLKYFLEAFYRGESLYSAVKEARGKLEGLEDEFPCATWLPVIYQNSPEAPPTWKDWQEKSKDWISERRHRLKLYAVALTSLAVTACVVGVRSLGMFQPTELKAFDQMLQWRPEEGLDERLLIVKATEEDFQQLNQDPLHDETLAKILKKIEAHKPIAIGIDLYRDLPQGKGQEQLLKIFKESASLIAICKRPDENDRGFGPPPANLPQESLGFNDVPNEFILRRQLLSMDLKAQNTCPTPYSLSFQLATRYLEAKKYSIKLTKQNQWQIGSVVFKRLLPHSGGYQKFHAGGYQILLNYRLPIELAESMTITDILKGRVHPEIIKNRIVLIGADTEGRDRHFTPFTGGKGFSQDIPGVLIHAQMVSQILSAVEDGRPLLSVWSLWGDALWILAWALVGGLLAWRCQLLLHLIIGNSVALIILGGVCFNFLLIGAVWIPFVPSSVALVVTSTSLMTAAFRAKQ